MKISSVIGLLTLTAYCGGAPAYETGTHNQMSRTAAGLSILVQPQFVSRLGLLGNLDGDANLMLPNTTFDLFSIRDLIGFGSIYEDTRAPTQALRHFYNPRSGAGITLDNQQRGEPSPVWIIDGGDSDQPYSYKKAREAYYDALTNTQGPVDRKNAWGRTFQTLGHVVHHLQDMSQPQHVRNDVHCDALIPCMVPIQLLVKDTVYAPSLYEQWVANNPPSSFSGYAAVNDPGDNVQFRLPKAFWSTSGGGDGTESGAGIAEYTHRGFLSAGTLIWNSALPSPNIDAMTQTPAKLEDLCAQDPGDGCPTGASGDMLLYGNTVTDSLRSAATVFNDRAATSSVFDQELVAQGGQPILALNRFNLRAARDILVPRAVGYSAGMINYFFRGNLEIKLPDEGVYGIVDHSTKQGFKKIKLKVSAPDTDLSGNPQSLSAGTLVAVFKFRRNKCWQDDLSGYVPYLQGGDYDSCRTVDEEIIVSNPANNGGNVSLSSQDQPFTFEFGNELPLSATDVRLQVVYKGKLSDEDGAVVVATRDVGEPTFFSYMNASDYSALSLNGEVKVYTRAEINADPNLVALVQPPSCIDKTVSPWQLRPSCLNPFDVKLGLRIGGSATVQPTRIDIDALPPQRLMRVAFLADSGTPVSLAQDDANTCYPHGPFSVDPLVWQLNYDNGSSTLRYAMVRKVRGVAQWYGGSCVYNADGLAPGTPDNRDVVMTDLPNKDPVAVKINGDAGF